MEFWKYILSHQCFFLNSPFFFLLIAQTTQFAGCCFFSLIDVLTGRVSLRLMLPTAAMSVLGFVPFVALWYFRIRLFEKALPEEGVSLSLFLLQFLVLGTLGDFFHYLTHVFLHKNKFLRQHVHSIHHKYEGQLYSWIVVQVHPLEVCMITLAIYTPLLLLAHPLVLWTFTFFATLNATFAHSGYEGGFASVGVPLALTADDHQHHHDHNCTKNYGNILRIWDYVFHTYEANTKYPSLSLWKMLFNPILQKVE